MHHNAIFIEFLIVAVKVMLTKTIIVTGKTIMMMYQVLSVILTVLVMKVDLKIVVH